MIERVLSAPRQAATDWRSELREFFNSTARREPTWNHIDRRLLAASGGYLNGKRRAAVSRLVIIRDTSGSINDRAVAAFMAEAASAWDGGLVERMTIIDCDARIHRVLELEPGEPFPVRLAPRGGGGTAFKPALAHVRDMIPDAAGIVYFTDLICEQDKIGSDPGVPVLWAAWGRPSRWQGYAKTLPFGDVIHVDPDA